MISVIVPVRNGMPWFEEQLGALVTQQVGQPWELVVADNGSTDRTGQVTSAAIERHPDLVRLVDASAVAGPAAVRNIGVRAARGDTLAFCDADDVVQPGWLGACAAALESVDVAGGVFDFGSLNGFPEARPAPASMVQLPFLPAGLGANLAVRRAAFEAVGGFDEGLSTGEDVDLCWRLQTAGFRFALAPEAVVCKRERTAFGDVFRQGFALGRGGPVLYRKHRGSGAGRNLSGAARSWLWLLVEVPRLLRAGPGRNQWARAAGMRLGRLSGSVSQRVFFP